MKKAIVLLSGGLDSATTLYFVQKQKYKIYGLIFDYGQRHRKEIQLALKLAERNAIDYELISLKLPWGGSALLDKKIKLPQNRTNIPKEIPVTYVPARNIIFLSYAASFAEAVGAQTIFIGANAIDYSGYPDCRPDFFRAYQNVLKKGMKTGVDRAYRQAGGKTIKIQTPLIRKTKAEIIRLGLKLGVPYELTWSCYQGQAKPCRKCDSCLLREKGFAELNLEDPLIVSLRGAKRRSNL